MIPERLDDPVPPLVPDRAGQLDQARAAELVRAWLAGRSPHTLKAYGDDLRDFTAHLGVKSPGEAARTLLTQAPGPANGLALAYRAAMLEKGLAPSTVNRRLAALRSLVKLARMLGLVTWAIEVGDVPRVKYRDTRGPGRAGFVAMYRALQRLQSAKAARDRAILRLLYDVALRRGEVVSLDLADVDLERKKLQIVGKGRLEPELVTIPEPTRDALAAWIAVRGPEPGPLFVNFDRAKKGRRLTGKSVGRLVSRLGEQAGLTRRVRAHGLRHAAITEALDRTQGNVRAVQRFSRHRDLAVVQQYDDNREDLAGEVAALVATAADEELLAMPDQELPGAPAEPQDAA